MGVEIEAAGDFVTGMVAARAVEPGHGETSDVADTCLNCGARMAGGYCHVCGQKSDVHRSIGAFWHDFTHSILHFEGKIWRTLPLLVFRPGELTRRYVHGERARFVSPLALFLFSVFLMFAIFSTIGLPVHVGPMVTREQSTVEGREKLGSSLAAARAKVADLERKDLAASGPVAISLKGELIEARRDVRDLEMASKVAGAIGPDGISTKALTVDTGNVEFDARIRHVLENPQLLLYKMQSNAYKFSWALVLISLPFIWLAFAWRRQFHLFDHLVFVTYSLCFITLLLVSGSMLVALGIGAVFTPLILLGPPLHLFAQLRGAYALSGWGALWRTAYLLAAAFVVLLIFGLFLLGLGI